MQSHVTLSPSAPSAQLPVTHNLGVVYAFSLGVALILALVSG